MLQHPSLLALIATSSRHRHLQADLTRMSVKSNHFPPHRRNKSTPVSTQQIQLPIRESPLQTPKPVVRGDRRVTFEGDTHPMNRSRSRNLSVTAGTITPIDSRIGDLGGTTSTLKCLPHRLRVSKTSQRISSEQRIEELTRETGHLRQELAYHKETRAACMQFFDATRHAQQDLYNAIAEMSRRVAISEQRFESYWRTQSVEGNWEEHVF